MFSRMAGKARLMGKDVAQRDLFLAEFRPDARDGLVKLHQFALDQHICANRAQRLAHRKEIDERVAFPFARFGHVGITAPQIDDIPAADCDGNCRTRFAARGEILRERFARRREFRIAETGDGRRAHGYARALTASERDVRRDNRRSRGPSCGRASPPRHISPAAGRGGIWNRRGPRKAPASPTGTYPAR